MSLLLEAKIVPAFIIKPRLILVRPGKWKNASMKLNRSEVVLNRLLLGHTHMTHGYLIEYITLLLSVKDYNVSGGG